MKVRNICILLISVLLVILIFIFKTDTKMFKIDGIKYAVSVDGEPASSFPEKGAYDVEMICDGAIGKWNYEKWIAEIYDVFGEVSCSLSFVTKTKTNLNDYIVSLTGTTQGNGEVVNENGYRYEGKNPNNYIKFNNELWRIIGVFDESSHGISETNLVKIIRNDSIGSYVRNLEKDNNWATSSLYNLLNTYYYNATDGTSSGYCYRTIYNEPVTGSCDYTAVGIQEEYRDMVANVTWFLGGYVNPGAPVGTFYESERGTTVYSENPVSITARLGLMYASDFGYSASVSNCARTTNLSDYYKECSNYAWISKFYNDWVINHSTYSSSSVSGLSFMVVNSGILKYDYPTLGADVRPVLYLDSSVYTISGDGTKANPYIIHM